MEFEQIVRRLEFLEEEQRKGKSALAVVQEQVSGLTTDVRVLTQQVREVERQVSPLTALPARLEQVEEGIRRQREEILQLIARLEKKQDKATAKVLQQVQNRLEELQKSLEALRSVTVEVETFEKALKARADEAARLRDSLDEVREQIRAMGQAQDDMRTAAQVWEEARRRDLGQLTTIQGELTALRKRLDEQGQKIELQNDTIRTISQRVNEVIASESDRKQAFEAFIQKLQVAEVDGERRKKELEELVKRFDQGLAQFEGQRLQIDEALRSATRAENTFAELQQKLERRMNEISEMQRLGEERLRQEWVAFRAEEQKRWTTFTLLQEQNLGDLRKALEALEKRQEVLENRTELFDDQFQQTTEITQEQLQSLMNLVHEWLTAYKRTLSSRPPTR